MFDCAHLDQQRQGVVPSRSSYARYAIYYTPQPGTALAAFGRSWFGRANDGVTLQAFSDAGLAGTSFAKLAVEPGRYSGLHALFRAPFAPRDGVGLDAIKTRLINFAGRRKPVETGPADLGARGPFPRAAPGRGHAGARVARSAMRRFVRGLRRAAERYRARTSSPAPI